MTDQQGETRPGVKPMSEHLAVQVKRLREGQRLPILQLVERLTEMGRPIGRNALAAIEKGERKVDIDEIAALAKALGVPPLRLILPVGDADQTEVLPGVVRDTWTAAKWFSGRAQLDDEPPSADAALLGLYQRHDELVEEAGQARADIELWPGPRENDPEYQAAERRWRLALRDIRALRAEIRRRQKLLPPLDDYLDVVDDRSYRFLTRDELATNVPGGPAPTYPPGLLVEDVGGKVKPVDFSERREERIATDEEETDRGKEG